MRFKDFIHSNFILVLNLEKMKLSEGMLQLKMKFNNIQSNKHVLLWMPVYEKKLQIDKNLDVSVE